MQMPNEPPTSLVMTRTYAFPWNSRTPGSFLQHTIQEETMPRNKVAKSPSIEGPSRERVDFSAAQGSSRNDESDLRDVARKAAKKSQDRKADEAPRKKDQR
jgi:hypothetical protein